MSAPTAALSNFGRTLKDIAAEIGLTHEALYRAVAALERGGEIRRGRDKITLLRRV